MNRKIKDFEVIIDENKTEKKLKRKTKKAKVDENQETA